VKKGGWNEEPSSKPIAVLPVFVFVNNRWLVSNIDEGSNSLQYVEIMKTVPGIERALDQRQRTLATKDNA
jgi:hypothetical protein